MPSNFRRWSALSSMVVLCLPICLHAQKTAPALPDVLTAAAAYAVEYSQKMQALTAEEEYLQMDVSGGRVNSVRRLSGDVVMVGLDAGSVVMFRDTYAIDTKPMHARTDRLLKLFTDPPAPPARSLQLAQDLTEDSLFQYVTKSLHTLDSPLLPLELLRDRNQAQVTFKLDGVKTANGAQVAALKFTESPTVNLVRTPVGIPVTGRLSVEMPSGALRQAEVIVSNRALTLRCTVTFTFDKALSLWVPEELNQRWDISATASGVAEVNQTGAFEAHAKYTKYKQMQIDLARIR